MSYGHEKRSQQQYRYPPLPPHLACLLHYVVVGTLSVLMHDRTIATVDDDTDHKVPSTTRLVVSRIGIFFGLYWLWLLSFRLYTAPSKAVALSRAPVPTSIPDAAAVVTQSYTTEPSSMVWYEMPWLCNMTLIMSAWGLMTDRINLALAYGLTVSIDQLLWYVDGVMYIATGKTIVGVFRHMLLPTVRWYHHLTTWHHVWTIPLLLVVATTIKTSSDSKEVVWNRKNMYHCYYHIWLLSGIVMTINVLSSRCLTPAAIYMKAPSTIGNKDHIDSGPPRGRDVFYYYLNVNLSYEVWKDLSKSISFLRIQDDRPSTLVYLCRLLTRWMLLNTVILVGAIGILEIGALLKGHGTSIYLM